MSPVIHPTGRCFDDVVRFVEWRLRENPELVHDDRLIVVHGVLLFPKDHAQAGQPFAHAWAEEGNTVWQSGLLNGQLIHYPTPLLEFITELRLQECSRYTVLEAARLERLFKRCGPWVPRYGALTVDGRQGAEVAP